MSNIDLNKTIQYQTYDFEDNVVLSVNVGLEDFNFLNHENLKMFNEKTNGNFSLKIPPAIGGNPELIELVIDLGVAVFLSIVGNAAYDTLKSALLSIWDKFSKTKPEEHVDALYSRKNVKLKIKQGDLEISFTWDGDITDTEKSLLLDNAFTTINNAINKK